MVAIQRILCPLDFSRFSRHALEQAVALAREFGAEISALHVYLVAPVVDVLPIGSPIPIEPIRLSPSQHAALIGELRDFIGDVEAGGLTIQTAIADGDPVSTILERATAWDADLIVMGTHGRTGFDRLLLGSVTERVLRKAPCPVLTVPNRVSTPTHGLTFARILCAVDFSDASFRALEYAASLSAVEGPGITVLNVVELFAERGGLRDEDLLDTPGFRVMLEQSACTRLRAAIPDAVRARCRITEMVTLGKGWKEILRVAAEQQSDLVVLGVHGRRTADLRLFGSTTQHVVRQAACPVLTIRA